MFLKLRAPEVWQKKLGSSGISRRGCPGRQDWDFGGMWEVGKPWRDSKQEAAGCLEKSTLAACSEWVAEKCVSLVARRPARGCWGVRVGQWCGVKEKIPWGMGQEHKQQDLKAGWLWGMAKGRRVELLASQGISLWCWRLFPNTQGHMHPHKCLIHKFLGVSAFLWVFHLAGGSLASREE